VTTSEKKRRHVLQWLAVSAVVLLVTGCGGTYDSSVTGVITLDGAPLPRGTVKFIPEQSGPSGYGLIGSDGSYEIMTGREAGLKSGRYVVTVVVNEQSTPNKNPSLPPIPGKPITPAWYRNQAQSPLKHNVEPGSNEINLELSTKSPAG
jgi:hypothetical protein